MRCANCGFENLAPRDFCEECGHKLVRVCPRCGNESGPTAKFCGACGGALDALLGIPIPTSTTTPAAPAPVFYTPPHLAERILAEQAAMEGRGQAAGERKTITALFADIAGSTALIQDLDPEEARSLIDPVVALMMEAVHHYEGYVAKALGDGILALFGAPIAHEDHALRALFAALRMQETMRCHSDRVQQDLGVALQIRVGVHTGEVVVRSIRKDDLRTEYDPVGPTIHIAARMEGVATPSSIVVSESTHRLTEGYFEFKALGQTPIKGVRDPLAVYEVLGLGALRTRLQVGAHRGLARFVGRETELERLTEAFELAKAGQGQIVAVVGEAGVGKSRLFHEFKACSKKGCMVLETVSVSHGKAFPYLPLIDLLKTYFQISARDDESLFGEKVRSRLLTLDLALEAQLPYLLYLLGISEPGSTVSSMDPVVRRQRTFEAIALLLLRESCKQPLVILFEDLQWLDAETEAFLSILVEHVPVAKILLLVNFRPEYARNWVPKVCHTDLHLEPLEQAVAQGLLTSLLGDHPSLAPEKLRILTKTEGNPFFMEEVVKTLLEENVLLGQAGSYRIEKPPLDLHIPTTVQGVLAARIDRLSVAQKELLQTLAIIGKEFPFTLIEYVTKLPEVTLHSLLRGLEAGDFIYERPAFPEVEYAFKHALTQEVAGNSLLTSQRSVLHERTARAIEALFPGRLKDYCSELAHHYSKSGNLQKAIEYLQLAGQQALERSAQLDAIRHLNAALELLKSVPDTPERAREELTILLTLGPAWVAARGHGSPEVEATYMRALALCEQGAKTPESFSAQYGLWSFYYLRAQFRTARVLADRLLAFALETKEPEELAEAHRVLATTVFRMGEIKIARTHAEQALVLHRAGQQSYSRLLRYAQNPAVHMRSTLGKILWYLGSPDQARVRCDEAMALARQVADPFALALSLIFAADLHRCRREVELSQKYADAAIALSTDQGYPLYRAWGTILRGSALSEHGSHKDGIDQIKEGLSSYEATGAILGRPTLLTLLAEAYGKSGQAEAGLSVLSEAIALVNTTGECFDVPMLLRLKGDLIQLHSGSQFSLSAQDKEAEACFHEAIGIAHRYGATSVELQVAIRLARLWQRQGKADPARLTLAEVHRRFTEGFVTADWQEAKALLEDLG
ncbi:adenylate/guanylate cyclase domain-containing protein [Cupriavidus necator]|uniref:adenylate/guanylate cyclase domain-containing protein n=1 Tax=Cupriavidus necator TaxID=106590 RepID=UPI0005B3F0FC|nr:adenylate/guanylate cyclase domain-containing protein [Cupriavidus necator]